MTLHKSKPLLKWIFGLLVRLVLSNAKLTLKANDKIKHAAKVVKEKEK